MPTVEELKALGSCWTEQELHEAATTWPSANPSWTWFLGARLTAMPREQALLRLQMASAALYRAGTRLPRVRRLTDLVKYAKACNSLQLAELGAAMGALLDGNGNGAEAAENVAKVLSQSPRPEPPPQAAEPTPQPEAPPSAPPPSAEESPPNEPTEPT